MTHPYLPEEGDRAQAPATCSTCDRPTTLHAPDCPHRQPSPRELCLGPVDSRVEYDPVDLWAALARVLRHLLRPMGTTRRYEVEGLLDPACDVIEGGRVLDDARTAEAAGKVRQLAREWATEGFLYGAIQAERLAKMLLGEKLS